MAKPREQKQGEMNVNRLNLAVFILLAMLTGSAKGKTSNGNDFALYLSEARTPAEQKELIDDAKGRPHYFRYLCIVGMQEGKFEDGRPYVNIKAMEPASLFTVLFTVQKPVSLQKLREAPESNVGDAIAVTGKIDKVDPQKKRIELNPIIIRHKDRLAPKIGKELFYELDPNATCYSFTEVSPGVQVPYKHRDLLTHKEEILGNQGPRAWVDFLNAELAKRKQSDKAGQK